LEPRLPHHTLQARSVGAAQGWAWIVGGARIFRKSPAQWIGVLLLLFIALKLVNYVPVLALVAVLLMPVFLAGLMDGCRALAEGRRLEFTHLLSGFRRNAAHLVTLGGVYLVGNLLILMIVAYLGGEAFTTIANSLGGNTALTPEQAEQMRAAAASVTQAALVGTALSVPLLMALWFAPLLTFFHDVRPWPALRSSFLACLRNVLPMSVYGLAMLAALVVLVPLGFRLGFYDAGLWMIAPVLVPSIYASYQDLYPEDAAS
jgi:hypothetical protein